MKKKILQIIAAVLTMAILCGCQANPEKNAVVSKNDGAFDAAVVQPATTGSTDSASTGNTRQVQYTDSFTSTDGTVEFTINIDTEIPTTAMPVTEVTPRFLTEAEIERFCVAALGEGEFYLDKPEELMTYSRQQLQTMIARWSQYTTTEALESLGYSTRGEGVAEMYIQEMKDGIAEYTRRLETTAEGTAPAPCEWKLDNTSYAGYDGYGDSPLDGRKYINARADRGDMGYLIFAEVAESGAVQGNAVSVMSGGRGPLSIDNEIFYSKHCTDYPTQAQIEAGEAKAREILGKMDMGSWAYATSVKEQQAGRYLICVEAQPEIYGVPAIQDAETVDHYGVEGEYYTSHYEFTRASFEFAPDGTLMGAMLLYPTQEVQVVNENVATLSIDELLTRAKEHLSLSDYYAYGVNTGAMESNFKNKTEDFQCKIEISKMDYGMLRIPVKDTKDHYYYAPGIALIGSIDFYGKETGQYYASTYGKRMPDGTMLVTLLTLNAIDGSVVPLLQND